MKLFKLTAAVAIAFVAITYVDGNTASAATWFSTGAGTDWFTEANWAAESGGGGGNGVPALDDDVTIQNGHEIIVDDLTASVDTVTIDSGGTLSLVSVGGGTPTTGILRVQVSVTNNGTFRFNEATDAAPILRADGAATLLTGTYNTVAASGGVFDNTAGSDFRLPSGSTIGSVGGVLTISSNIENDGSITTASGSAITISGNVLSGSTGTFTASTAAMTISGDLVDPTATFSATTNNVTMTFSGDVDMDGIIEANGGNVTFDTNSVINNDSIGTFRVTHSNSTMRFQHSDSTAPSLTGDSDFQLTAGTMRWSSTLTTAGGYQQTGGTLQADAGETFTANGAY